MAKKDEFEFVNDIKSDIDMVEDDSNKEEKSIDRTKEYKKESNDSRRVILKRYLISGSVMIVISALIIYLLLLWQDDYSLMAWGDALWVAFIIEFFVAWIFLVYNLNILSPMMYGYKAFFLMFLGKKQKLGYYEYMQNIENNPIPKFYIIVLFLSSFILFVPALITLMILI